MYPLVSLLVALHIAPAFAGVFSWVSPVVARQTIGGSIGTDKNLIDGINLGVRYKGESSPSYIPNYYTRLDQYNVTTNVYPGQILPGLAGPIGFALTSGTEITFARQFDTRMKSIATVPYGIDHLPVTSEKALCKLVPGDFASFTARMNLMVSANTALPLTGPLNLYAGAYVGVSGDFNVQIFRLRGNKVRVRIIAQNGRRAGVNASVGSAFNLRIFSMETANNLANNEIRNILHINPLNIYSELGRSDLFVVDMVYDLGKPESRAAYDTLMGGRLYGANKEAAHLMTHGRTPSGAVKEEGLLLADLTPSENLVSRDANLPSSARAVDRLFKGTDASTYTRTGFSIDLNVASAGESTTLNSEKITSTDRHGNIRRFIYQSVKAEKTAKLGWGYLKYQESFTGGLLMNADDNFNEKDLSAFGVVRDLQVSEFGKEALEQTIIHLRQFLPGEAAALAEKKIRDSWKFEGKNHRAYSDASLRTELYFDAAAVDHSLQLNEAELAKRLKKYIDDKFSIPDASHWNKFNGQAYAQLETRVPGLQRPPFCQYIACFGRDIEMIAHYLAGALSMKKKPVDRLKSFQHLKEFSLFREIGGGFLASLLPKEELDKLVKVKITMRAKGAPPVDIETGTIADEISLLAFQKGQELLFNRSTDVRLYRGSDGELTSHPVGAGPIPESMPAP